MAIYFMSFMLQNSDSGAYTDYAVTRRRGGLWLEITHLLTNLLKRTL